MNKKIQIVILSCYLLGLLILSCSHIFIDKLSDFALGFCEGISVLFILVGFIYMCWCFAHKKNPFKIDE